MTALKCPCCGQPAPEDGRTWLFDSVTGRATSALGEARVTSPIQRTILNALAAAGGNVVSSDHLLWTIYGGRDEPEWARPSLNVHIHRLRHLLRPIGIEIETQFGAGWRIDPRQELRAPQAAE